MVWSQRTYTAVLSFTHHLPFFRFDLLLLLWVTSVSWTYRAHKACVVPGESQSLQELVPGLDGEVAAVAGGPEQVVVVWTVQGENVNLCARVSRELLILMFLSYLVRSTASRPPCGTCCLWLAVGRRRRWSKTRAKSVSGHSWPPAQEVEENKWEIAFSDLFYCPQRTHKIID